MNRFGFEPDFDNLRTVLLGGKGHRVPNIELVIDKPVMEAFMGRAVDTVADEVAFRYEAGYDYVWVAVGMIDPANTVNRGDLAEAAPRRDWAHGAEGMVTSPADIEAYPWPRPQDLDLSAYEEAAAALRPGMKTIGVVGKIFTAAWELTGFERFCAWMYEQPELLAKLVRRIGRAQLDVFYAIVDRPEVGAVWAPDDVAYHNGPMVPPAWIIENVYPYYHEMAEACRKRGKPFLYHSDGNLWPFLDAIVDFGADALHPIEPEALDIYEMRAATRGKLCLLGNIRVDTLSRGTPAEIRKLTRDRVTRLGHEGAYCVGSSNSVPDYVPLANYQAMLKASADYGTLP